MWSSRINKIELFLLMQAMRQHLLNMYAFIVRMSSNVNKNPDISKRYIKTIFIHLVYFKRRALDVEAT